MKTSITAIEQASWGTPLVLRGSFTDSIAQAAQLGYEGIELHIMDSGQSVSGWGADGRRHRR